jgi:hypothetical protein
MNEKLCIVQFLHPGGEHRPDDGAIKWWNTKEHKRKFLVRPGKYATDGKLVDGQIEFWGEWEPESRVIRTIADPIPHGPRFIYDPYYVVPDSYIGLQNTDPFVFGERFHYTGCQQRTSNGATQLRFLSRGSVILFGSCQSKSAFTLDTVFVVDHWIDHDRKNYSKVLNGAISQEYSQVTISAWYQEPSEPKSCTPEGQEETWRLYFGASYDKPVGGMYSFFPCRHHEPKSIGFARPTIEIPGVITNNLSQGKKFSEQSKIDEMRLHWDKVVGQVRRQGLALGVYAGMPQRDFRTVKQPDGSATKGTQNSICV